MEWSQTQGEIVHLWRLPHRYIICTGSVRSGKTECTTAGFMLWSGMCFSNHTFLIAGKTRAQIQATLLPIIRRLAHATGLRYQERLADKQILIGANTFLIHDAGDASSAGKLQGVTLSGALLDEVVLYPESFLDEVEQRTSVPGAKIVMTGNPAGPSHIIKTRYIDRAEEIGAYYRQFGLPDNPAPWVPDHARVLARQLTGHMFRRRVMGEWAAAIGVIYPHWTLADRPDRDAIRYWDIGVDYASTTTTHALLVAVTRDDATVYAEWRYHHGNRGQLPASQQAAYMRKAFQVFTKKAPIRRIWHDPAAANFASELRAIYPRHIVLKGYNKVEEGIEATSKMLESGQLKIAPECIHLIDEIRKYEWDPKAAERGEDKPQKVEDHGCDALRYWAYSTKLKSKREIRVS